jgi:DNA-binding NarL/FixJ family response regulator
MLRILVADDHAIVRRNVCGVLDAEQDFQVCGEASTGLEAVEKASALKPDLVVLDLSMPLLNGLDAARQILSNLPQTEVLILTMHESPDLTTAALASGARACLTKTDIFHLPDEVRALLKSGRPCSIPLSTQIRKVQEPVPADKICEKAAAMLSDHERQILRLLAQSKGNREIAIGLSVSFETVEACLATMMRKLEFASVLDLVRYAIRETTIEDESQAAENADGEV